MLYTKRYRNIFIYLVVLAISIVYSGIAIAAPTIDRISDEIETARSEVVVDNSGVINFNCDPGERAAASFLVSGAGTFGLKWTTSTGVIFGSSAAPGAGFHTVWADPPATVSIIKLEWSFPGTAILYWASCV